MQEDDRSDVCAATMSPSTRQHQWLYLVQENGTLLTFSVATGALERSDSNFGAQVVVSTKSSEFEKEEDTTTSQTRTTASVSALIHHSHHKHLVGAFSNDMVHQKRGQLVLFK